MKDDLLRKEAVKDCLERLWFMKDNPGNKFIRLDKAIAALDALEPEPEGQDKPEPDYRAMWKDLIFYALSVSHPTNGIVIAHHKMLQEEMKEIEAKHTPASAGEALPSSGQAEEKEK